MEQTMEIQYIRPRDVAKMYSISPKTVYRACESGDLPSRKISRKIILIDPRDIEPWLITLEQRSSRELA
jgi:predicted DNA-binding transcriptional regulator AlpA